MKTFLVGLLISLSTSAEKPAAIQICIDLPSGISLFSESPQRNYRAIGDGSYALDLDVLLNGSQAPERITRSGARCVRAWIQATPIHAIAVSFDRTDLNLRPQSRAVILKLRPDLWYDGGTFTPERGPYSNVSTSLRGKLTIARLEGAGQPFPMRDLSSVPVGRYAIHYEPPPKPLGTCAITVNADAVGTVRTENRPELVRDLVETYRRDFAPEVAKRLKIACTEAEALELQIRIVDGAYCDPLNPRVHRVTRPELEKKYELVVDGKRIELRDGLILDIGYGQHVVVEEAAQEKREGNGVS